MTTFWLAFLLIMLFGVELRWLPIAGSDTWLHFVMPSVALAAFVMPAFLRITRTEMIEALASDYVRTARAMGHRPFVVVFRHALRNAVLPVVSVASVPAGFMLGGSVVDTIFACRAPATSPGRRSRDREFVLLPRCRSSAWACVRPRRRGA